MYYKRKCTGKIDWHQKLSNQKDTINSKFIAKNNLLSKGNIKGEVQEGQRVALMIDKFSFLEALASSILVSQMIISRSTDLPL